MYFFFFFFELKIEEYVLMVKLYFQIFLSNRQTNYSTMYSKTPKEQKNIGKKYKHHHILINLLDKLHFNPINKE
jgi:hypothetical protein